MRPLLACLSFGFLTALCLASPSLAAEAPTVMTVPGKLIYAEDFKADLPSPAGSTAHYASGFQGWRRNVVARGGQWHVADGVLTGRENPDGNHPATASYGFDFKDIVVTCELRLNDVPLLTDKTKGFRARHIQLRTTDAKDYVCGLSISPTGWNIAKLDNDHGGPDKSVPLGNVATPIKLGEWNTVVFEVLGDELTVTVNGKTLTGRHPLIGTAKHSVMFVTGAEGSMRNLRIWEAAAKPDWPQKRAEIGR